MLRTLSTEKKHLLYYAIGLALTGLVLGILIVKFAFVLPVTTDGTRYDATAVHLIETGDMLVIDGQILPPGYPYFLAGIYSLFGHSYEAVYLIQFFLIGVCGALTFYLARIFFKLPLLLSLLIGLLVICWPYMVLHAMLILSEVFAITLLLLGIVLLLHFIKEQSVRFLIASGLVLGVATLARPVSMLLPFWIVILSVLYFKTTKQTVPSVRIGGIFLATFLLPLVLWSTFLFVSQGATSGFMGFVPGVISKALNLSYEVIPPKDVDTLPTTADEAASREFGANTEKDYLQIIKETKRPVSEIVVSKMRNVYMFWNPGAGGYQAQKYIDQYPAAKALIWIYRIGFIVLLALAFLTLRSWKKEHIALFWIIILYFWGVHSVLFPYPRYMLPLIPFVLILAGVTIMRYKDLVLDRIRKGVNL